MNFNQRLHKIFSRTNENAKKNHYFFVTPESVILTLCGYNTFREAYAEFGGDISALKEDLKNYLTKWQVVISNVREPVITSAMEEVLTDCQDGCEALNEKEISISHFLTFLFNLEDIFATYYIRKNATQIDDDYDFIKKVCEKMGEKVPPSIIEITKILQQKHAQENLQNGVIPIPIMMNSPNGHFERESKNWKEFVTCLSDKVQQDTYIPLIGRKNELTETIAVLLRKDKNNPVHVGEAGVGKTAITEGLAKLINDNQVPESLQGYKIYSCSMGSLVAGTSLRGEFEERLKSILEGVSQEKAILYIDEIHTIVGAGGDSASSAANILKPYLLNGDIKIIGATTLKEYRKYIESDSALERRFSPITVEEPTKDETKQIIDGIKHYYEEYHKCIYSDDIIDIIINLSEKYMSDKFFPDKAIDILDESGAYVQLNKLENNSVTQEIVEDVISRKCNIPRNTVDADETSRIKNLSTTMKEIVIGQDAAIDKINENIVLSRSGLRDDNKPVANLLFVGPTGVGKTFIAETLADSLGIPFIRKDMSEFTEGHSVAKLFGSPAGYVGYDEGGLLINEIRKSPHCVLLLDEIEKAHPDVYNVFLQIMDNAKLTDSFGKSADFRNVILIMTSNAGAEDADRRGIGYNADEMSFSEIDKAVNRIFRPEFRNRLDAIIKFNPMSKDMAVKIAKNQMKTLSELLLEKNVFISYSDDVIEHIVKNGYSKEYGARNIKRIIDKDIKINLANEILFGFLKSGGNCSLSYIENELTIQKK